ncbi:amidohydrolase family protein [Dokdonella sp.]|uniref:amidohydrolase family protein n=1 Tax=Dokdonella sp. TaxID=2291710 RepID=UPI0025BF27C4|nr:amidohydrolase family protein [Dokdonella sp.]MBX3692021.1 amidohydrolase family protein [Dokdonella sp.]
MIRQPVLRWAWYRFAPGLLAALVSPCALAAPGIEPVEGIADRAPSSYAITHARAVVKPGQVIDDATIIVRDGRITGVGVRLAVPGDLVEVDLGGRSVFAGFIDANARYGQSTEVTNARAQGGRAPAAVYARSGPRHWNRLVHPEVDVADAFKPDAGAAKPLREMGFVAVLSAPQSGILRGQSALALTADATRPNEVLLKSAVAQHIAFEQGQWPSNEYPSSLMGSIALVRQTLHDVRWRQSWAVWQKRQRNAATIEANLALDALVPLLDGRQPAVFATTDELDIGRALAIASEFDLKLVMLGNGHEYRRVSRLKSAGVPVILPLDWPEAPAVEDPDRALDLSLAELEHWEWAPHNPRVLAEAGVPFAFTTAGLKKPAEQFWSNLRKAVVSGLGEDVALAGLTTQPAAMLGVSDRLGSIETGRMAAFVIADAGLFRSADARIHEVWIGDQRHVIRAGAGDEPRGTWTLQWSGADGARELVVSGETPSLKATLGDNSFPATWSGTELTLYAPGKALGRSGERVAIVATLSGDRLRGRLAGSDGREVLIEGVRTKQADAGAKPVAAVTRPPSPLRYPAGEFGVLATPAVEDVVVRGATIWTQGPQGRLEQSDLHVAGGRIRAVGRDLAVPRGTREIDARGKHVSPGIIDAHSHIAIARGVNEGSDSVTSEVRVGDVLDPTDISIYRQLAGGVTSSHLLHGSANTIGGQAQLIKLRWGEDADGLRFAGAPATIKFALGENVKQANWGEAFNKRYPQTRMGVQEILRDSFVAARAYATEGGKGAPPRRRDLRLEALAEVLDGRRFVHIHSYRQDEILGFVRIAGEYGIVPTFQHVLEGYKVADELAKLGAGASTFSDWWAYKMEVADAIPYNGALMTRQGVVVSFNSDSDELARRLNTEAAKAVKYGGLDEVAALDLVTRNPARQLRVDARVGSLQVGMDADFVIWSDNPLSTFARVEQTWIDGRRYFDHEADTAERLRIDTERERLIAKALPERVKALAAKPEAPAASPGKPATPEVANTNRLVDHIHTRSVYHAGESLHVCTEAHE